MKGVLTNLWRCLMAAAVVLPAVVVPARTAAGAAPGPAPSLTLLSQTPWIVHKGVFDIRLRVRAPDPSVDQVEIEFYQRVIARSDFDSFLNAKPVLFVTSSDESKLTSLRPDARGNVDIPVPVNTDPTADSVFSPFSVSSTGVYPVQISLLDGARKVIGDPLFTFLVFAQGPAASPDKPLSVAVVVPVQSPPVVDDKTAAVGAPGTGESSRLSRLVGALSADPSVGLSIDVEPQTLQSLSASASSTDRRTLQELAGLAQSNTTQVLPSTYTDVSVGDLTAANLNGELGQQFATGEATISNLLHVTPAPSTWAVAGPLDTPTLDAMIRRGATRVIAPDGALTSLGAEATFYGYFPSPTLLAANGEPTVSVYAADPGLSADIVRGTSSVLAANQLLADLALVYTSLPGNQRGMVVLPPANWIVDPTFVATLLHGLDRNPLLRTVTASGLFNSVPQPDQPITRSLASPTAPDPVPSLVTDAPTITAARANIQAVASVFSDQKPSPALGLQLLTAESTQVTEAQRQALLAAVIAATDKSLNEIKLPPESSITLTSTHGHIPLTILSSPSHKATVQLRISSGGRLIFQAFNPPGGHCQVPSSNLGQVVCNLTLVAQNTTIQVPVQARSSGQFPLDVELWSPDGSRQLPQGNDTDTVRSTAISGVGVILIVLALVGLAVWWVRDLRHGRRARRLVPSPIDLLAEEPPRSDPLDEFFNTPPPADF